ncbi:RepA leader peptide Tap [Edwardsiella anguillarum]
MQEYKIMLGKLQSFLCSVLCPRNISAGRGV